jgi:phosphoribosylformimino-5-aminoimidazole carboxamide ribotide isomerase
MKIIPASDILDGAVVRLKQGDYNQVENYSVSIEEMIEQYLNYGFDLIHIVDLNGAKGEFRNQPLLNKILKNNTVKVQFGGGIRTVYKAIDLLESTVERVIIGTAGITESHFLESLALHVDTGKVVLSIDVLDKKLKINGWQKEANIGLEEYIQKAISLGFNKFLCTDISKDGLLSGPSTELYTELCTTFSGIHLIASGGVQNLKDIEDLSISGVKEVVVGKAIYEGALTLEEICNWNKKALVKC